MAEFCEECYKKIFGDIKENERIILSFDKDICEECGEYKRTVLSVVHKSFIAEIIIFPFKLLYNLIKLIISIFSKK